MAKILEFKKINFSFGKKTVFKDFSFSLDRGATLAIVGKSGSGKSTIVNLIAGILQPRSGEIIKSYNASRVCFQDARLISWLNIRENICLGIKNLDQELFKEVISCLKIKPLLKCYPDQISGGQKHRVAVARSIVSKAELLIFDESFASLDEETKFDVINYLERKKSELNQTFLVISHSESELISLSATKIQI